MKAKTEKGEEESADSVAQAPGFPIILFQRLACGFIATVTDWKSNSDRFFDDVVDQTMYF